MGYTHYWYRKETEVPAKVMRAIVDDFKKILPTFAEIGIPLAGGLGEGNAEVSIDGVWFNGVEKCGHAERDLGITWPSPTAEGFGKPDGKTNGHWFAGALLETRTCGGDCSHETLHFPRVLGKDDQFKGSAKEDFFACCKTAYKPYDVAVTAFLIIAKHHMGDSLGVHTDGEAKDWKDAQMICTTILGYPANVQFDDETGDMRLAA